VTRASQYATGMTQTCDVVIIGGGIIGLSIARKFLEEGPCRVVVLEKSREICCGATGAGQGYIWLAHREPDSAAWEMATRSKDLWSTLTLPGQPVCDSEWQVNGSMLVASCPEEARELELKAAKLSRVGIQAQILSSTETSFVEPALRVALDGATMVLQSDAQLNGRAAAHQLLQDCHKLDGQPGKAFSIRFGTAVTGFQVVEGGQVVGVHTEEGSTITAERATVAAAGAWTGSFLAEMLSEPRWKEAIGPRPGQLLELDSLPPGMVPLSYGIMEMSYAKHYQTGGGHTASEVADLDITFTATCGASGELLIGSSREFYSVDKEPGRMQVTAAILQHAAAFLPHLSEVAEAAQEELRGGSGVWKGGKVRVGPRPWAARGLPMVGEVPGHQGLWVAAGHEGSGLTLAPVTAELVEALVNIGGDAGLSAAVIEALSPSFESV